jgi:hypothetical protein
MKLQSVLTLASLALLFIGCAEPRGSAKHYRYFVTDEQIAAWHKIAVEAATSPDTWARLKGVRRTSGPLNLELSNLEYNVGCSNPEEVEVVIRRIVHETWHDAKNWTFVSVTIDRYSWKVLSIEEVGMPGGQYR